MARNTEEDGNLEGFAGSRVVREHSVGTAAALLPTRGASRRCW